MPLEVADGGDVLRSLSEEEPHWKVNHEKDDRCDKHLAVAGSLDGPAVLPSEESNPPRWGRRDPVGLFILPPSERAVTEQGDACPLHR